MRKRKWVKRRRAAAGPALSLARPLLTRQRLAAVFILPRPRPGCIAPICLCRPFSSSAVFFPHPTILTHHLLTSVEIEPLSHCDASFPQPSVFAARCYCENDAAHSWREWYRKQKAEGVQGCRRRCTASTGLVVVAVKRERSSQKQHQNSARHHKTAVTLALLRFSLEFRLWSCKLRDIGRSSTRVAIVRF